jgi:PAS domain S-box-containing protein
VKFANRALERIHGYEPRGMVGIPFVELIAPGSKNSTTKHYELRMQGEPVPTTYAIRILCKDGQEKDATVASAGQIRYCGKPAILGIVCQRI